MTFPFSVHDNLFFCTSSIEAIFLVISYPKIHEVYYLKSQYGTQNSMSPSLKGKMAKQYARHGKILKY